MKKKDDIQKHRCKDCGVYLTHESEVIIGGEQFCQDCTMEHLSYEDKMQFLQEFIKEELLEEYEGIQGESTNG